MMEKHEVHLNVNGIEYRVMVPPHTTLLTVLRDHLGLIGTKRGCEEGECGVCTVLVEDQPVYSCLTLAVMATGKRILTIEGLEHHGHISRLQEAFVEAGAIQCGFCTPGMIISAYALLKENPHPSVEEIQNALAGNICRCTGYHPIVDAVMEVSREGRK